MAKKKQAGIFKALSNTRTRTFVIFFGAILAGLGLVTYMKTRPVVDPLEKAQSKGVRVPIAIQSVPGAEVTQKYKELTQAENKRRAEEAIQQNSAAIPTIIGAVADEEKDKSGGVTLDDALEGGQGRKPTFQLGQAEQGGFIGQGLFQSNRAQQAELQERRLKAQRDRLDRQRREREQQQRQERERIEQEKRQKEYQEAVGAQAKQMAKGVKDAAKDWNNFPAMAYIEGYYAKQAQLQAGSPPSGSVTVPPLVSVKGGSNQASNLISGAASKDSNAPKGPQRIVKAGTILYAVLDTSIDSDVNSPVLATIVHGPFRGGKLIGQFKYGPRDEALLLEFKTLSLPKEPTSYQVQIVAVDADTAKTALKGDLDKHYFVRYGSLFASAFIEGYAEAISQQGTTTTSPLTGASTTTKPSLSGTEEFFKALGKVGQKWGQAIQPLIERPYTMKIPEGTGIGLLFLNDTNLTPRTAGS